jgi:hypothetical protein
MDFKLQIKDYEQAAARCILKKLVYSSPSDADRVQELESLLATQNSTDMDDIIHQMEQSKAKELNRLQNELQAEQKKVIQLQSELQDKHQQLSELSKKLQDQQLLTNQYQQDTLDAQRQSQGYKTQADQEMKQAESLRGQLTAKTAEIEKLQKMLLDTDPQPCIFSSYEVLQ